jgi:hypothetical protein
MAGRKAAASPKVLATLTGQHTSAVNDAVHVPSARAVVTGSEDKCASRCRAAKTRALAR